MTADPKITLKLQVSPDLYQRLHARSRAGKMSLFAADAIDKALHAEAAALSISPPEQPE